VPTSILLGDVRITGTGVYEGYTYDKLEGWYGLPDVDLRMKKRPNQPGAFSIDKTTPAQATISIEGQYFGTSEVDALRARERLLAIYADGRALTMKVDDSLRTTSRVVQVASIDIPWTARPEFKWTIDLEAADPKRYAAPVTVTNGLALAGSGLSFESGTPIYTPFNLVESPTGSGYYAPGPLVETTPGSGYYAPGGLTESPAGSGYYATAGVAVSGIAFGLDLDFGLDFGTTPNDGRITVVNDGTTEATSTYVISGGSMPDGADIVNIATGERLTYIGPIVEGTYLEFDPRTQAVFLNGANPMGRYLPNPAWWVVPAGGRLEIQFVARGPVTGAPVLSATTAPAYY
jgi:hypothetical protein